MKDKKKSVKKTTVSELYVEIKGRTAEFEKALDRIIKKLDRIIELQEEVRRPVILTVNTKGGISPQTEQQVKAAAARGMRAADPT